MFIGHNFQETSSPIHKITYSGIFGLIPVLRVPGVRVWSWRLRLVERVHSWSLWPRQMNVELLDNSAWT